MNDRPRILPRQHVPITSAPVFGLVIALMLPAMAHASAFYETESTAISGAYCYASIENSYIEPLNSEASSSQSGVISCNPSYISGDDFASYGFASSNLFTGILEAEGAALCPNQKDNCYGNGSALLYDTITVVPPAGTNGLWVENGMIGLTVDGSAEGQAADIVATLYFTTPGTPTLIAGTQQQGSCEPDPEGDPTDCNFTVEEPFSVSAGSASVGIFMSLGAAGTDASAAYAVNTGQAFVTFDDPGYTFTSASGVFLTEQGESTPEPDSVALIGSGLLTIGLFLTAANGRSKRPAEDRPRHGGQSI